MAFDDLIITIRLLMEQMDHQAEDRHELYVQLHEKLNELRAMGMPLPEDLVALEKTLEAPPPLP